MTTNSTVPAFPISFLTASLSRLVIRRSSKKMAQILIIINNEKKKALHVYHHS